MSNGKAWMTSKLLGNWLKSWDDDLNDVKKETIQNCFSHCGLGVSGEAGASSSENCDEPIEELDDLFSQLSEFPGAVSDGTAAKDFVTVNDHVATTGELADEDIVADLASDLAGDSNCEDPTSSDPPTCSDALHALSVVCRHCASIEGCVLSFSESLNNVDKCMLNNALKIKKQKKIGDYFSR
ncbi:hypothetical protein HPB49_006160 [Dermacentor silvarum]|uniref:Uncharacterized protein n=1 Tax=Dermacentor silvarum TaxID=543639 RepID=A0ACB8DWH0_DERSI|nr:hypothetical protein HPB49_006160 [Dermacentor silvarum]